MPRWKKYTLITVASIFGLLLLSMLIVPWQIKAQGSKWFAENTTRRLTIEKAFFNPFALTVEVKGVSLTEQQSSETFVSLDRLMLSASSRSLLDFAVIFDRVELDAPYANIELLGKQEFNFSDFTRLGDGKPQPPQAESSEPLLFSFNNIVITAGQIDFTDQTSPKKSQHQISELNLSVPFVGNVSYLTDEYVEPQLSLLLNGSEISAIGQLKPFHQSLETSLSLVLNEVDLAFYAFHSPVPLPVDLKTGVLDTQIDLSYRISASEQPKLLLGGELALSDIDIRQLTGENLFRMPTLILDLDWADLMQQDFNIFSLDIYAPEFFVNRAANGAWNFQQLATANHEIRDVAVEDEPAGNQTAALPLLIIEQVALFNGKIHYQDEYPLGGFSEEIGAINLQLDNLSTHMDELTELALNLRSAREMSVSLNGRVGLNPLTADLALLLNGFQLKPHYPFVSDLLTRPLEGSLNLATTINFGPETSLKTEQMQLALHQLKVPFTEQDYFTLKDLSMTGGSFDLQQQLLKIGNISLIGGDLQASRDGDGALSPLALLRDRTDQSEATAAQPSNEPVTVELPWQKNATQVDINNFKLQLDKIALEDFDLQFTDNSLVRKPQLKVADLMISLADLAYPESQLSPFKVDAKLGKKGSVALSGNLAHSPLRVQAQTQVNALALADFNNFLPEKVKVSLKDGKLYTNMAVKLLETPEALTGNFAGSVTVSDFNLRDPLIEGELLAWENLNLTGIKGDIAPFKLGIKDVSLNKYLAKIQIDSEGRVNLANVTATEETEVEEAIVTEEEQEPVEVAAEEPAASGPPADIRIDALTLQGGTVSFTDRSMPNIFSATMYKLGGRVTGMASDEQMLADVDLRGELENHSPLTIVGKLNPLSKDLYADLTISFKDIDLAPMTPYSGTYLGYAIDKGKLYLDLSYHIEHQKIKAKNKIVIDQFTFGDSVKSDKATTLPVSLAIALLKDRNDEIHLDVPISGDMSDPSFSITGTIFTVLKNLLVKAATAPFSLLASMLGGGGEDFSTIAFASGMARLDEKQSETLAKLAEMLAKRPSLTLEISAYADGDKDPEAYRKDQLQQKMIEAKWLELKEAGQAPESRDLVSISPEDYPVYLLEVYKDADFPRPRNFVGMLKNLPETEMEKLLLANIRADGAEMQALAQSRAQLVRDQLIAANEAIKPRIFLKSVDIYQQPEKGPASRVEFRISSK